MKIPMMRLAKQLKAKLLTNKISKTLSQADYLRQMGYNRLYGWKMEEATQLSSQLLALTNTQHRTPAYQKNEKPRIGCDFHGNYVNKQPKKRSIIANSILQDHFTTH